VYRLPLSFPLWKIYVRILARTRDMSPVPFRRVHTFDHRRPLPVPLLRLTLCSRLSGRDCIPSDLTDPLACHRRAASMHDGGPSEMRKHASSSHSSSDTGHDNGPRGIRSRVGDDPCNDSRASDHHRGATPTSERASPSPVASLLIWATALPGLLGPPAVLPVPPPPSLLHPMRNVSLGGVSLLANQLMN
jgi:hypothetical protein